MSSGDIDSANDFIPIRDADQVGNDKYKKVSVDSILNNLSASDSYLRDLANAEGYEMTQVFRDSDGVITSGIVSWNGVPGVFTTITKNNTWLTVDAYTLTYAGAPAKTLTQPLVTRDANGAVIVKPLIIIS